MNTYFPTTHTKPARFHVRRRMASGIASTIKVVGTATACCLCYALAPNAIGAEDSPISARSNGGNMAQVAYLAGNASLADNCTASAGSISENPSPDAAPCERTPSASAGPADPVNMLTVQPLPLPDRHWRVAAEFNAVMDQRQAQVPLQQVPGIALK